MASAGKKGKKSKWIPASITDIIAEPTTIPTTQSWADAAEEEPERYGYQTRPRAPVVLPSASRAACGGLAVDDDSIPRRPPYVAYISNLPYDVDETAISELFAGLKIQNLRLPREGDRLKGFGYVDFEDRESLVDAMNIADLTISGRRIRIEVSTQDNDRRMGSSRGGRMGDRERDYDPERTSGDWRSGPRTEAEPPPRSSRPSDRDRDRQRDREREGSGGEPVRAGAWRDGDRPVAEPPRTAYGGRDSYGRDRDRGGFEERGGFRDGADRERGYGRDGFRDRDRDGDRDRGYGSSGFRPAPERSDRFREGDRGGSRGFGERRGFGDRDRERDPPPPPREEAKPRERPKLNLLPRTVPRDAEAAPGAEDKDKPSEEKEEPRVNKPTAAAVFGGAKPVDTAAKEREIEERLKKQEEEARQRGDERERWGRRGDGAADSRAAPRRDDRGPGRESRSYRDADRRDDRRDYSRDKDRDTRDYSRDKVRDSRDSRDSKDVPRDTRDSKDSGLDIRDTRDVLLTRNSREDTRDSRKSPEDTRDSRDSREDVRDSRDSRDDTRDDKDTRPSRDSSDQSRGQREGNRDNGERGSRSEERGEGEEEIVLPKLKEKEAPNFAVTNKFSFLEDADGGTSD